AATIDGAVADLGTVDPGDRRGFHPLDRPRPVPVQSGAGAVNIGAEAQHHTLLVRLHAINTAGEPECDDGQAEQRQAASAAGPGRTRPAGTADDATDERLE